MLDSRKLKLVRDKLIQRVVKPPTQGIRVFGVDQLHPDAEVFVALPTGEWDGPMSRDRFMQKVSGWKESGAELSYEVYIPAASPTSKNPTSS